MLVLPVHTANAYHYVDWYRHTLLCIVSMHHRKHINPITLLPQTLVLVSSIPSAGMHTQRDRGDMKPIATPIYRNHALKHLPQSTEPRAILGSKYVMATPAQFVKLSEG